MQPLAQYRAYCGAYGDRDPGCAPDLGGRDELTGPERIEGNQAELGMARLIHRQVVQALVRRPDRQDVWSIVGTGGQGLAGDCDDVVMTAIHRLVRRGFPRGALRATVVELPGRDGHHLLLGLHTSQGDVFLDDRVSRLLTVSDALALGYRFVAQEMPGQPIWWRIDPGPPSQLAERPSDLPGPVGRQQ
ncbi:transglutaminase-like cysteine peptidase [Oleisolibacter albus]|uniref:transglutaminase-like cysteine peptidase n=1 Tax=Oleisolibacter albus TaxID=2171757 RepID=UPI00138FA56C|nr:transglutaminase-like cysteine peptidase [Oleisolibacter albus]